MATDGTTWQRRLEHAPEVELAGVSTSMHRWRGFQTTWDLCAVTAGDSTWRYRHRTMESVPGSIRFKEPGESFRTLAVRAPCTFRMLRFEPSLLELVKPDASPDSWHLRASQLDGSKARFRQLCALMDALQRRQSRLAQQELLVAGIAELLSDNLEPHRRVPPPPSHRAARLVREFIDENFEREIALEELARLAEVHPIYLSRLFREQVGLPPHAYQNERRVVAAQALLREGMGAADVAVRVGFFDQSHFIRHFKRATGVTPRAFVQLV